jgi:hypothetical protein
VGHISGIAAAIANGQNIAKTWDETTISREICRLSDKDILQITRPLFPSGIPINISVYESLASLQHCIGFGAHSQSLVARVWRAVYNRISKDGRTQLLQLLPGGDNRVFWMSIRCLPEFLPDVKVEPEFLSSWLVTMAERVGQDLAGGPLYIAVQKHACQFPRTACTVFEKYVADGLMGPRLTLGAIILGSVRSVLGTAKISERRVRQWERTMMNSPNIKLRLCQHRSWAVSYNLGAISIENLRLKLSEMLHGLPEEVDEAFSTVHHCLLGNCENSSFVQFATKWFIDNSSATIPGGAKHYVVSAVHHLSYRAKNSPGDFDVATTNNLIAVIQPIPEENQGTWSELEYYLVDRLCEGQESFGAIIEKLADVNAEGLSAQFSDGKFRYLVSEMSKCNVEVPLTKLILSKDRRKRRLAMDILRKIDKVQLSQQILDSANEAQLKTILVEFTATFLVGKGITEFLLALEPSFIRVGQNLRERFMREVTFQAINYPYSCLKTLKDIQNPSNLIQNAISAAEKYFDGLREIGDCPAVSFYFPQFKEMDEKSKRALAGQVSKSMREQSVLVSLVKHVQIVYGSTWSNLIGGKLSDDSKFAEFHEDMEFPRLESIDTEGMKIRRIQAALELQQLEAQR